MTYQILKLVYDWCDNVQASNCLENKLSPEYLVALSELATALKKVMKFN